MGVTFEEARVGRRARMIPAAASRADVLGDAAAAACDALRDRPSAELFEGLAALGQTGVAYDEWCTTLETTDAAAAFASPDELAKALATRAPRALAVSLGLLAAVEPARVLALVRAALPLDDTHFAPNYLEAYIQRTVAAVLDRILGAAPPDDFPAMFAAGQLVLEKIPAPWVARLSPEDIASAARSDALGYVHRDEANVFLRKHPAWSDGVLLTELYRLLGDSRSHAALAMGGLAAERLLELGHAPAAEVAAELLAKTEDATAGPRSLVARWAFQVLVGLRHQPTRERVFAELDARVASAELSFDPSHTKPALRAPIAAGLALDPATAAARFAPYFTPAALATEAGATVAHDVLRAAQGLTTDHQGTRLGTGHGSFLAADPGWVGVVEGLVEHPRFGPLARRAWGRGCRRRARRRAAQSPRNRRRAGGEGGGSGRPPAVHPQRRSCDAGDPPGCAVRRSHTCAFAITSAGCYYTCANSACRGAERCSERERFERQPFPSTSASNPPPRTLRLEPFPSNVLANPHRSGSRSGVRLRPVRSGEVRRRPRWVSESGWLHGRP